MLKTIMKSKTKNWHLLIRVVLFALWTFLIQDFIMPFVIWGYVGDGVYPHWWDNVITPIWVLSAMILLLPVTYIRLKHNVGKDDFSKAKSYVYAALAVLAVTILNLIYVLVFHHSIT